MRKFYLIILTLFLAFTYQTKAQDSSFSFNCARDTTVNLCASSCVTLTSRILDIHASTNTYAVNQINGVSGLNGCFSPHVDPSVPGTSGSIALDDTYSPAITVPFTFPFFGTDFTSLHISSNGYLSFDPAIAAGDFSHYQMLNNGGFLSSIGGTPENVPSTLYDRALIMGPYHDIDIAYPTSPTSRVKYDVLGVAPHRKWVASYYKIPLFDCEDSIENTHQIALLEGSGIVEVFLYSVQNCLIWNEGRAMVGMQNYNRDQGIMAPGRACSDAPWGTVNMNESWRFVPTAGPTLYRGVQLYDLAGSLISTGDTTRIDSLTFQVSFPTVCPTATTTYIVKTTYEQYNNPGVFFFATDTVTVNVIAGVALSAAIDSVGASCSNNGIGSATVTVTGGTGPYEYSLDGITFQASNIFNLPAGTYTIYYHEVGGACIFTKTVTILQDPTQVAGTYDVTNADCFQGANGAVTVTATIGTTPFQYAIDGGGFQPTGIFTGLAAGPHVVTIKDNTGCLKDTTIIITEPAPLQATFSTVNATCTALGSATILPSLPGNYEYSSDGVTWVASPTFPLAAGTYTLFFRPVGTTCSNPVTVTVLPDPNVVAASYPTIDNALCFGGNTGAITVAGSAGTPPYQYQIDNLGYGPSGMFTGLTAGPHIVSVKDNAGCIKDTTIILLSPPALQATPTPTDATCSLTPNGVITPSGSGGTPGYTYSIDGTTFGPGPFTVANGAYTVTIKDLNGCTATAPVTVALTNDLTVQSITDVSICLGASVVLTTSSNYAAATYAWTGTGLNNTNTPSPTATPTTAGVTTYDVTASFGGCQGSDQVQITTGAQVVVDAGPDASITSGNQIQLTATATGATSYLWTSVPANGGLSSTTILNPVASPTVTTTYTLTATNAGGCTGSDNVTITVGDICVKVRNAFSPNGDGTNDLWKVYDLFDCLKNVSVHVYNRYGSLVYESKDYRNTWDGRYQGKPVPDGTYYAVIDFTLQTGKTQTVKTDLTVIR